MDLSLTEKQLHQLLEYTFIGYQVIAGNKDMRNEDTEEDIELMNYLYKTAYENGSDVVANHAGDFLPTKEFENELLDELKEYEEDITFENLTQWLALRDMNEDYNESELENMDEQEHDELLEDYCDAYSEELSEFGVENLYLIDDEA